MPNSNEERLSRLLERIRISREGLKEISENILLQNYSPAGEGEHRQPHTNSLPKDTILLGVVIEGSPSGAYRHRFLLTNTGTWIDCSFKENDQMVFYHALSEEELKRELLPLLTEELFRAVMNTLDALREKALRTLDEKRKILESLPTSWNEASSEPVFIPAFSILER